MLIKNRWSELKSLSIIYSTYDYIEFNGTKYPKAYIAEHGNKVSINTAIGWASDWQNSNPQIIDTDNSGFEMQIVTAPDNSSQSGKLAFWMCIFTKANVPSFATGINSELLSMLILGSDIAKGKIIADDLFFAKLSGQLGVLHTNMPEYQEYLSCLKRKEATSKNKTKNWKVGYSYVTSTKSDIMLGTFNWPFVENGDAYTFALDFNGHKRVAFSPMQPKWFDYNEFESLVFFGLKSYETSCPARTPGEKIFDHDSTYDNKLVNALEKITATEAKEPYHYISCKLDVSRLLEHALLLYTFRPEKAIELLKSAKPEIDTYKDRYLHDIKLIYDGNIETYQCDADLFNRILKLTEQHYAKMKI